MIERKDYINQLIGYINSPFVKILTGIRRSGKSSILLLLEKELQNRGVEKWQILHVNMESFANVVYNTARSFYEFVANHIHNNKAGKIYLLVDEIQEIEEWEKAINSFMVDFDIDIYITGSNSHLLSSELATYLTGRYVEIPVFTLSYAEYRLFRKVYFEEEQNDAKASFIQYLRYGGFPVIHAINYPEEMSYKIIYDIYSSAILRDTVQRYKIRDVELLERVIKYSFDNIGNTFSGKNVADFFKSQHRKADLNTIYNYLHALEGAFILYRTSRYDINGKEILKTQEKFYLSDIGLLYATMGYKDRMISGVLENIVFLELKRRGYNVFVGKIENKEIDFIAEKQGNKIYVQVAYKLESAKTVEREFGTLLLVNDQYPKFVVTMDDIWKESVEGIRHFHISDFLLSTVY